MNRIKVSATDNIKGIVANDLYYLNNNLSMSSRIETEKKYYCVNNRELLEKIKMLNYKLISVGNEVDEYFTDINSEYIKKRTSRII